MENNELKENIRKKVKEKIAISNIREEFDMKTNNKRKIIVGTLSVCAMCVLCLGIALNTDKTPPNISQEDMQIQAEIEDLKQDKDKDKVESQPNNNEQIVNKPVEEGDTGENEPVKETTNKKYPTSYGGRYIDSSGNNVVWICDDSEANRKEICNFLGITENKTIFKVAKYSYNYLEDLQSKISKKMSNKEISFVTTSSLREDSNNIVVTVTSNNESDLNKIKALDTIGGAIDIQYNTNNSSTKDLLVKTE